MRSLPALLSPAVFVVAGSLILCAGCRSGGPATPNPSADSAGSVSSRAPGPDPSTLVEIARTDLLVESQNAIDQGLVRSYVVRGTHNQLTVFFEPRTPEPRHKDLAAYAAWADDLLKERQIRAVSLDSGPNPIKAAGLPFVLKTYVNVHRPGQPAPTSICDAAGLRFETPGGFWTISCNADRGRVDQAVDAIKACLGVMHVQSIANTGAGTRQ